MAVEKHYAVLLYGDRIGTLSQRGDYTQFRFNERYLGAPDRPVLGLRFEENLRNTYAAALRLPAWFSNLLPEGPLREWIAQARGASVDREMELLAQVGHDLPGAVQVLAAESPDDDWQWDAAAHRGGAVENGDATDLWRFSMAGVALKFSMLAHGDRLTVPAFGERGDWLVKFPDYHFPAVPLNEYAMMRLAGEVGIEVPAVRLVHRDEMDGLPSRMWPNTEEWAYAVERFDRAKDARRTPIHIEDFAQVRDWYAVKKYDGAFESVAAIAYRGRDVTALREVVRRLVFSVLVGNGDAHLKNWSLIYRDRRTPELSPAYDLVSTFSYRDVVDGGEDMALKLNNTRRFEAIKAADFQRLEARVDRRLGVSGANLVEVAHETADRLAGAWPRFADDLAAIPQIKGALDSWTADRVAALRR